MASFCWDFVTAQRLWCLHLTGLHPVLALPVAWHGDGLKSKKSTGLEILVALPSGKLT